MFRCLTPWSHAYGWPMTDEGGNPIERCTHCGKSRPARLVIEVNPKFAVPKHQPKVLGATVKRAREKKPRLVQMDKRKSGE